MAEPVVADILAKIKKRRSRHAGIGIASDYVSTIGACFGQEGAERFFGMGSDRQWAEALKDSQGKLVYRDDDMKVIEVKSNLAAASKQRKYPTRKPGRKDEGEDGNTGLTPGACMEFDCVLTTAKRDRDRDILEPGGARVDPYMPLLWQHVPMSPIGKMLKVVSQDENEVIVRCAIADNAFGRDVAQLVEFGALRISHGFVPTKFEPIEEDENADPWMQGWHVLEFDVLEVSVVSIPSNTDAVITGFSRGKLHHPLVKSWAQAVSQKRPTTVPVGGKPMTQPIEVHVHLGDDLAAKAKAKKDGDEPEKEEGDEQEQKMEVSELASLGRVHLMLEQLAAMEGLPDEALTLCNQAKAELEATMNGGEEEEADDDGKEPEQPVDKDEEEEEEEEEKEGEEEEDKDEDDDAEPKDPQQMVNRDEEDAEDKDEEDDDEEKDGDDDVEPGDDEGRADEKGYDLADDLFHSALSKFKNAPPVAKKAAPKSAPKGTPKSGKSGKGKTAPKKGK